MVVVRCPLVPKGFCVNVFGTVWARDPSWLDSHVLNHERIHTAQQRELLFVPFYVFYLVEWLWLWARRGSWRRAYYDVSFEREAYAHGHDMDYLRRRRRYAQWRGK